MNAGNTVKKLLKPFVPENVLRLKRCIGIVRSLHKRFDSTGYVPTQEDMNQMALIRRTYKKDRGASDAMPQYRWYGAYVSMVM